MDDGRALLTAIADGGSSLICLIDDRGRVIERGVNPAFQNALGCTDSDAGGRVFWEHWIDPREADDVRSRIEDVLGGAGIGRQEHTWRAGSGAGSGSHGPAPHCRTQEAGGSFSSPGRRSLRDGHPEPARTGERFSAVVESSPLAIIEIGLDDNVRLWNPAAEAIFGWSAEEVLGRPACWIPDDRLAEFHALSVREGLGDGYTGFETVRLHRDGRRLDVEISAAPIRDPAGDVVGALALIADITDRKRQAEELRASRARIVEAADDARRKLERNLHDGAQQRLVALSISLRLVEERLSSDPAEAAALLADAREELALALVDLRELARGLHPAVLTDRGLAAAVQALASRSPLPVAVDVPHERLPPAIEAALYYFVAESLTNVARYADATSASVRLELGDEGLVVAEVSDDGRGGADPAGGSGLRGLADRIEALDGRLVVHSHPGGGTRVRMEVPVARTEAPLTRVRERRQPPLTRPT